MDRDLWEGWTDCFDITRRASMALNWKLRLKFSPNGFGFRYSLQHRPHQRTVGTLFKE